MRQKNEELRFTLSPGGNGSRRSGDARPLAVLYFVNVFLRSAAGLGKRAICATAWSCSRQMCHSVAH